jgi:hypothetical protein
VRLEIALDPTLEAFKFDYQKVSRRWPIYWTTPSSTPAGGSVTLCADPHFWERRGGIQPPTSDRRRQRSEQANSVRVAVADTGTGIAAEHHQEIFEDFVRVDRTPQGWDWVWQSRNVWYRHTRERFGSTASRGGAAPLHSCYRSTITNRELSGKGKQKWLSKNEF